MDPNTTREGLEYVCADTRRWFNQASHAALIAAAAFTLAYLAPDYVNRQPKIVHASQKGISQQNLDAFVENGWDSYLTGPDAFALSKKNPDFQTGNADLKKAWEENRSDIKSLFPGVEQAIENYLDGNAKNDEATGISVGKDDYVMLRVKSASKRVGFERQNTTYYVLGKQFSKEAADTIRSISPKYTSD